MACAPCRKEWRESTVEMARRKKVTAKGSCVGRDAISTLRLVWHQFADSFESFPFSSSPLDWHSTLASASFRDFRTDSRNGKPDESFGFHDRKEGGGYELLRWGYPRYAEQTTKFPVQFGYTRFASRFLLPIWRGEMRLRRRDHPVYARQNANKLYEYTFYVWYSKILRKSFTQSEFFEFYILPQSFIRFLKKINGWKIRCFLAVSTLSFSKNLTL